MKRLLSARHLLVVAILVLAGSLALVISQRYSRIEPARVEPPEETADLALAKVDYTETRDGKAYWRLQADRASHDLETRRSRLHNVHFEFYGAKNADTMTLDAREGIWDQDAGELEVFGDVVARSAGGYRFATERAHYRQREQLLWTDETVEISSGQFEVWATGMRFRIDQRRMSLLANVRSVWQVDLLGEEKG